MSEEKFFAWLDGELSSDEAEEVARDVAADPALAARAQQHRRMAERLRAAFNPVAEVQVPERVSAAGNLEPDNIVNFAAKRKEAEARASPPMWKQITAMAASLALGIAVGDALIGGSASPVKPAAGRLVAAAGLEESLNTRLASAPANDGPRIGLTFRDKVGNVCRTFTDRAASGLACLESGDWRIRGLVQPPEGQEGEYRMAAGIDPNLAAIIDSTIQGEPFDAEQEKAARERGWR